MTELETKILNTLAARVDPDFCARIVLSELETQVGATRQRVRTAIEKLLAQNLIFSRTTEYDNRIPPRRVSVFYIPKTTKDDKNPPVVLDFLEKTQRDQTQVIEIESPAPVVTIEPIRHSKPTATIEAKPSESLPVVPVSPARITKGSKKDTGHDIFSWQLKGELTLDPPHSDSVLDKLLRDPSKISQKKSTPDKIKEKLRAGGFSPDDERPIYQIVGAPEPPDFESGRHVSRLKIRLQRKRSFFNHTGKKRLLADLVILRRGGGSDRPHGGVGSKRPPPLKGPMSGTAVPESFFLFFLKNPRRRVSSLRAPGLIRVGGQVPIQELVATATREQNSIARDQIKPEKIIDALAPGVAPLSTPNFDSSEILTGNESKMPDTAFLPPELVGDGFLDLLPSHGQSGAQNRTEQLPSQNGVESFKTTEPDPAYVDIISLLKKQIDVKDPANAELIKSPDTVMPIPMQWLAELPTRLDLTEVYMPLDDPDAAAVSDPTGVRPSGLRQWHPDKKPSLTLFGRPDIKKTLASLQARTALMHAQALQIVPHAPYTQGTVPPVSSPTPPLLTSNMTPEQRVRRVLQAYQAVVSDYYEMKLSFGLVYLKDPQLRQHRIFEKLLLGTEALMEFRIPPVEWAIHACGIWIKQKGSGNIKFVTKPPPVEVIFSAPYIANNAILGQYRRVAPLCPPKVWFSPTMRDLLLRWQDFESQVRISTIETARQIRALFVVHFPGKMFSRMLNEARHELAEKEREYSQKVANGAWLQEWSV